MTQHEHYSDDSEEKDYLQLGVDSWARPVPAVQQLNEGIEQRQAGQTSKTNDFEGFNEHDSL